ncbi:MAG: hypothetical protein AAGG72_06335, partial [Pseudomonadota bacterium]
FASYGINDAWFWGLGLGAIGAFFIVQADGAAWPLLAVASFCIDATAAAIIIWSLALLISRRVFLLFNRTPTDLRGFIFPALQLAKVFSPALLAPLSLPAAMLGIAQVQRQWTNYWVYRKGGDVQSFRRHTHRLQMVLILLGVIALVDPSILVDYWLQCAVIVAFCLARVALEQRELLSTKLSWRSKAEQAQGSAPQSDCA